MLTDIVDLCSIVYVPCVVKRPTGGVDEILLEVLQETTDVHIQIDDKLSTE